MVQTNFPRSFANGYPGMVANGETSNRVSRINQDTNPIAFGAPVFAGTTPGECTATVSANLIGIAMADQQQAILPGGTADTYAKYRSVAIMQAGVIWVTAGGVINAGQAIAALNTNGSLVASGTVNSTNLSGWVAMDAADAAGALIRIAKRI